jgi:type IV secretory pathway TraG/TraD family ATPase VirD4
MLLDREYRREALQSVTDSQVREFWTKEYPAMNYKTAVDGVAPIANKLGAFLAHPLVRKAVCEPERPLRFRKIMDEGQCLIVNLAKGRLGGDTANVLGGLVVSGLVHAAYSRQVLTEAERRPFFIYIDEFHSLTTETLADALPELRKYRVGMVLAHQHVAQLGDGLFESILGNVGNIIIFRVGAADAPILARHLAGDVPATRDLLNLPNYEFYVRMMVDHEKTRPFSARTLLPELLVSDS